MGVFNLKDQLVGYAQYHHHPVNQRIHMVFVPLIVWTVMVWANATPSLPALAGVSWPWPNYPLNVASLLTLLMGAYYIILDRIFGIPFAALMLLGCHSARAFLLSGPYTVSLSALLGLEGVFSASQIALVLHVVSWVMQFLGHGVFEGRAPALLDNLLQAIIQAPFFVWIEWCWWVAGLVGASSWRAKFREDVNKATEAAIDVYRRRKEHPTRSASSKSISAKAS